MLLHCTSRIVLQQRVLIQTFPSLSYIPKVNFSTLWLINTKMVGQEKEKETSFNTTTSTTTASSSPNPTTTTTTASTHKVNSLSSTFEKPAVPPRCPDDIVIFDLETTGFYESSHIIGKRLLCCKYIC